ncbi:Cadherin-13 [Liparis tanakae]|uniref:Cadherin-13 n=1 Tax=Liparis tanakae TaxID=230148 RepID=A0A4Z2J3V8_9TELE|nr:Cadherin-13 [Liparis tanakae]
MLRSPGDGGRSRSRSPAAMQRLSALAATCRRCSSTEVEQRDPGHRCPGHGHMMLGTRCMQALQPTLPTTTYELEIVAKDMAGSEVGLTGTATATITITDKNDHAPEFTHPLGCIRAKLCSRVVGQRVLLSPNKVMEPAVMDS